MLEKCNFETPLKFLSHFFGFQKTFFFASLALTKKLDALPDKMFQIYTQTSETGDSGIQEWLLMGGVETGPCMCSTFKALNLTFLNVLGS